MQENPRPQEALSSLLRSALETEDGGAVSVGEIAIERAQAGHLPRDVRRVAHDGDKSNDQSHQEAGGRGATVGRPGRHHVREIMTEGTGGISQGNTLVLNVTDHNDRTWVSRSGDFHSDAMKLVERFTPITPDALRHEGTVEDPNVFTRP